jgi:hypothetical protein
MTFKFFKLFTMKKIKPLLIASIIFIQLLASCSKKSNEVVPIELSPGIKTSSVSGFSPKSAKAGSLLTIAGELFGTNANVVVIRFADGADVKPKSVTPTQITVEIPAAAKTGQITLLVNGATLKTTDTFTLIP